MTKVLESEIGYHIFLLRQINPATTKSFEESEESIEGFLYEKKSAKKFEEWVTRLRKDAYIAECICYGFLGRRNQGGSDGLGT